MSYELSMKDVEELTELGYFMKLSSQSYGLDLSILITGRDRKIAKAGVKNEQRIKEAGRGMDRIAGHEVRSNTTGKG